MVKRKILMMVFDRCPDYIDDIWYLVDTMIILMISIASLPAIKTRMTTTMELWAWWWWWRWGWWACWRWSRWTWWRWAWWRWWQFHDGNAARMNLWLEKQKLSLLLHKRREPATMKMMRIVFELFFYQRGEKNRIWNWIKVHGTKRKDFPPKNLLTCPQTACLKGAKVRLVIIVFHIRTVSLQMSFF